MKAKQKQEKHEYNFLDFLEKVRFKILNPSPHSNQLKNHLRCIVNNLIVKKSRKEAMDILMKSDRKTVGDFLYYYHSDIGNVACLVLDTAKILLVKNKKMKQQKKDSFGWQK